jgi:hypothetical protein
MTSPTTCEGWPSSARHLQLVLDPITAESVDTVAAALADLER